MDGDRVPDRASGSGDGGQGPPRQRQREDVVMKWMMEEGGEQAGMQMLADVWREREGVVGRAWGVDQLWQS